MAIVSLEQVSTKIDGWDFYLFGGSGSHADFEFGSDETDFECEIWVEVDKPLGKDFKRPVKLIKLNESHPLYELFKESVYDIAVERAIENGEITRPLYDYGMHNTLNRSQQL